MLIATLNLSTGDTFLDDLMAGMLSFSGIDLSGQRLHSGDLKRSGVARELSVRSICDFVNGKTAWVA